MYLTALPAADRAEYLADRDMGTVTLTDADEIAALDGACGCGSTWDLHDWVVIDAATGEVVDCDDTYPVAA